MKKRSYEIDMCNGSIMDKLISFALPLMLSGILQLMFNAVDIIVVGRFSGSGALAAVGSTTALINVFTNLFMGISLGANVLAARCYAAGKKKEMSDTVHTSILLALISGIGMAVIGLIFAKGALELMGTPDDVIGQSTLYMRIYFLGMPFFMLYNYGAAILRAVGDTKRPLVFLIISGVVNALLNMALVIFFHLGVAGVAIATVISQMISCVLVLLCLIRSDGPYRLQIQKLKMTRLGKRRILRRLIWILAVLYHRFHLKDASDQLIVQPGILKRPQGHIQKIQHRAAIQIFPCVVFCYLHKIAAIAGLLKVLADIHKILFNLGLYECVGVPPFINGKGTKHKRRRRCEQRTLWLSCSTCKSSDPAPLLCQDHRSPVIFSGGSRPEHHPSYLQRFAHTVFVLSGPQ